MFGMKSNWWASEHTREVDKFCFKVRDGIARVIGSKHIFFKQNLSKLEFSAIQFLMENRKKSRIRYK